jgi:hypothetical protein
MQHVSIAAFRLMDGQGKISSLSELVGTGRNQDAAIRCDRMAPLLFCQYSWFFTTKISNAKEVHDAESRPS